MTKPSANERRLFRLLKTHDTYTEMWMDEGHLWSQAAFLAKRGVLAVSAQTVPPRDWPEGVIGMVTLQGFLRRLARGAK